MDNLRWEADPFAERRAGLMRGLMNQGEQIDPSHPFAEKLGRFMGKWTVDPVRETYGIIDRAVHGEQMSYNDAFQLALEMTGGGLIAGKPSKNVLAMGGGGKSKKLDRLKQAEEAASNGSVADVIEKALMSYEDARKIVQKNTTPPTGKEGRGLMGGDWEKTRSKGQTDLAVAMRDNKFNDTVDLGKVSKKVFRELNKIRDKNGQAPYRSREVVVPGKQIFHLQEKRMHYDDITPSETSDILNSAIFNKDTKVYPNKKTTHQTLFNPKAEESPVAIVSKGKKGKIKVITGFPTPTTKKSLRGLMGKRK